MALKLSLDQDAAIRRHGEDAFPGECCGFVLGAANGTERRVHDLLPAINAREDSARHNRYLITPENFRQAERTAAEQGAELIGFYHSHPNAEACPSQFDVDHAWPWYSYLILSVQDGASQTLTSWVLREDRSGFDQEELMTTP